MKLPSLSFQFCGLVCVSALTSVFILKLFASITQEGTVFFQNRNFRSNPTTHWERRLPSRRKGRGISFAQLRRADQRPPDCPRDLLLVILVTSAPWHSEQRDAIRNTWARKQENTDHLWQAVFLIGQPVESGLYPHIAQEQQDYGDILLGNYVDSYRNLTLKVMHGLWWAAEKCAPQFVLKTDDDCFVNTDYLPRYLAEFNTVQTGLYIGSVFRVGRRLVIRDQRSKWYVSKEDFREEEYPPYASGIGYVLSIDVVWKLVDSAKDVPPVPMEDAYVGILAREAGVRARDSGRFAKNNVNWRVCNYRYLMVIHHLDTGQLMEAQLSMLKARTACNQTKEITSWK